MNLEGKVERLFPVQSGTSARTGNQWMMMDFMIETIEQYPKKVVFTLSGEERIKASNLKPGLVVNVHFDLDTRFYTGKDGVERYSLGARAYKVEVIGNAGSQQAVAQVNYDHVAQNYFDQQPAPQQSPSQQAPQPQFGGAARTHLGGGGAVPGYGQQMQGSQQGQYKQPVNPQPYIPPVPSTDDLPF